MIKHDDKCESELINPYGWSPCDCANRQTPSGHLANIHVATEGLNGAALTMAQAINKFGVYVMNR